MTHSTVWLAELQFFISLSFMAIFFALELGLSWVLFIFRVRTLGRAGPVWMGAYRTWARIFAIAFVLSLAASIPVLILLGSLWPKFLSATTVLSSPFLAAIIVTTLIFKSSFLSLMLYAHRRLPGWLHGVAVGLVALLNTLIMVLLLAWVSWVHYPVGATWSEGVLQSVKWATVFSQPLFFWYLILFAGASFLLVGVFIQAVVFWQSIRRPADEGDRRTFRLSLVLSIGAWLALFLAAWGHGLWLSEHQAQKAAALSGYWETASSPKWLIAAWSDEHQQMHRFSLGFRLKTTPWLALNEQQDYVGLDKAVGMLPPVNIVFWAFRFVLLLGLLVGFWQLRTFWLVVRRHFDPGALSIRWRRFSVFMPFFAALLLFFGLSYQLLGVLPYAVFNVVTTNDIYAHLPLGWLTVGSLVAALIYLLSTVGFLSLTRYVARHGVIPVARHRGRA